MKRTANFSTTDIRGMKDTIKTMLGVYSGPPVWENYNFESE